MLKTQRFHWLIAIAAATILCCLTIGAKPSGKPSAVSADKAAAAAKELEAKKQLETQKQAEAQKQLELKRQADETAKKKKTKQWAQLDIAERMSGDGSYKDADATIATVLSDTDDPQVIERAAKLLAHNHSTPLDNLGLSPTTLLKIASWAIDILVGILILVVLYQLLKLARYIWSNAAQAKWRVDSLTDGGTNLGLADAIVGYLDSLSTMNEWSSAVPPATSGLLKLERLQLPSPKLDLTPTPLDLSAVLTGINVQVGGVSLSGIAGALPALRTWFNAKRPCTIKGKIIQSATELTVRLTSTDRDRRSKTVTATVSGTPSASSLAPTPSFSPADIRNVAEAASYQIFYLISKEGSTVSEAAAANNLREGLDLLGQSIYNQNSKQLSDAYEAFRQARTLSARLFEAYLYEGIALDLRQQHDEAIARFKYLENDKRVTDAALRDKATYNRAISLFRKYQYEDAKKATILLERLMTKSQLQSMARAARASVISQYPMYWREPRPDKNQPVDSNESIKARREREPEILKLISEVTIDKKHIEEELADAKRDGSMEPHQRTEALQLEWAIKSAWGNLHLNCAMYFYAKPYPEDDDWEETHEAYLHIAYNAFQECAMLITPGIEMLTNLAKVSLELNRIQQGCDYLEQAIKLNPGSEYAYYRLAMVREERKELPQLLSVLKRCEQYVTPTIAGFPELFQKYDTQLHPPVAHQEKPSETVGAGR
jgi:hypothetical protein